MKTILIVFLCFCTLLILACGCESEPQTNSSTVRGAYSEPVKTVSQAEINSEAVESKPDYSAFVGRFQDKVSQRAVMNVTENEDMESCHIEVFWGSSAVETVKWEMTGIWKDEKLSYTDCKKQLVKTNDEGETSYEIVYENKEGYFTFNGQNGALSWVGAFDEDCRGCVFEHINE